MFVSRQTQLCAGTDIGRTFATFAANIRRERQSDGCERPPIRLFLLTDSGLYARLLANGVSSVRYNYRMASYSGTLIGEWPPVRKQLYRSLRCSEDLFGEWCNYLPGWSRVGQSLIVSR